jgi:hypothetical protein
MTPWQPIVDALKAVPAFADWTIAPGWVANLSTPALIVAPTHREPAQRGCAITWSIALQLIANVASDDDAVLHDGLGVALANLPPGVIVGGTDYTEDTRAGATYRISTTDLTLAEG